MKKLVLSLVVCLATVSTVLAGGAVEQWRTEVPFFENDVSYSWSEIYTDSFGGCVLSMSTYNGQWLGCYDKTGKLYHEYTYTNGTLRIIANDGKSFVFINTSVETQEIITLAVTGKNATETVNQSSSRVLYQITEGMPMPVNKKGFFSMQISGDKEYIVYCTYK